MPIDPKTPINIVGDWRTAIFIVRKLMNLLFAKFNTDASGHNHDGLNSAKIKAIDVTVTPSGNLSSVQTQAALEELQGDIDNVNTTKANDADVVHKIGDESIDGIKTFLNGKFPKIVPSNSLPTLAEQLANKLYVDNSVSAAVAALNAFYVLTQLHGNLPNGRIHPNTGTPNFNVKHDIGDVSGLQSSLDSKADASKTAFRTADMGVQVILTTFIFDVLPFLTYSPTHAQHPARKEYVDNLINSIVSSRQILTFKQATPPSGQGESEGDIWYSTVFKQWFGHDGSGWNNVLG